MENIVIISLFATFVIAGTLYINTWTSSLKNMNEGLLSILFLIVFILIPYAIAFTAMELLSLDVSKISNPIIAFLFIVQFYIMLRHAKEKIKLQES